MASDKLIEKIDDLIFKAKIEQGEESKYRKQILALIKEAGYVQLADDQTLPLCRWGEYQETAGGRIFVPKEIRVNLQDMLKVVDGKAFRRVIVVEEK